MQNNQENTGKQGQSGQRWMNAKFVERVEMGIMQFAIMSRAAQQGGATRENLQQMFKGNMQMSSDHFDHCLEELVSDGHLKQDNGKYTATDDGREDVQKLQHLVLETPNVVHSGSQGGGNQQQKVQPQASNAGTVTGGAGGGSPRSGGMSNPQGTMGGSNASGSTGSTVGQAAERGTSTPQGTPSAQNQGQRETTRESGAKGGASSPTTGGNQNKTR